MMVHCTFLLPEFEAATKVLSMMSPSDGLELELTRAAGARLGPDAEREVRRTLAFAKSLQSHSADHPNLTAYLSHPVRVATIVGAMEDEPQLESVQIGLIHNVFEVCGLSEVDLIRAEYSERAARAIRLLTVDRRREFDADYVSQYCAEIERFGERLSLIRCVDKLDNILGLELFGDDEVRERYLDLALQFVGPMAARLSPEFGRYFEGAVQYSRRVGCNRDLLAKYQAFLADLPTSQ